MVYQMQIRGSHSQIASAPLVDDVLSQLALSEQHKSETYARMFFHVIVENQFERAATARLLFALGHHAEVYSDPSEFLAHSPDQGLVLVLEDGAGSTRQIVELMASQGLWLPVVGFAKAIECETIVEGIKAGVLNYIVGDLTAKDVSAKLRKAFKEGQAVQNFRLRQTSAKRAMQTLSKRESEVLKFVSAGLSNKEVARELNISPRTVEIHRMRMMAKLGAKTSAQAIRLELEAVGII